MDRNILYIVTGVSGSGKTTLVRRMASELYDCVLLSVDDFKQEVYEHYEFLNRDENRVLNRLAKLKFQAELTLLMRKNESSIIVEYPFKEEWNGVFKDLAFRYNYRRVVVNCVSFPFEELWKRKVVRDKSDERPGCLLADSYINGEVCCIDQSDFDKERHELEYKSLVYNRIEGDQVISDKDMRMILDLTPSVIDAII